MCRCSIGPSYGTSNVGYVPQLEYLVKTMNVFKEPPRFQVDTGPLIVLAFESSAERVIE